MNEPERLDRLDARARRAAAALHAATADVAARPPDGGATSSDGAVTGDYPLIPLAASGRGRFGRPRRAAMSVAATLTLLATGFAVTQLTGDDGAEGPEAAVQALFSAVDHEDALGVLESLTPSERRILVPSVQRLRDELAEVDVAGDDLDLGDVDGLDIRVEGLELRTQGLHPDVAVVQVTGGALRTTADFRALPIGGALAAALEEEGGRDLDEPATGDESLDGLELVALRADGGWHVSLLYSLAEADRSNGGEPVPDFGNGIPARGADSPRAAVDAMVAAFNEGDETRMIELTPLDSMAVLHDYGPGLIADDEGELSTEELMPGGGDSSSRLHAVELGEPEGSGDTRRLALLGYRYTQSYGGGDDFTYVYDGSCITSTSTSSMKVPSSTEQVAPDASVPDDPAVDNPPVDEVPADDVPAVEVPVRSATSCPNDQQATGGMFVGGGVPFGPLLFGPGRADIVVVERDGAWYVDPGQSIVDTVVDNVADLTPDAARRAVGYWTAVSSNDPDAFYGLRDDPAFYEGCPGVEAPADDASFDERAEAGKACEEQYGEGSFEGSSSSGSASESTGTKSFGPSPIEECSSAKDRAEVEACMQALVEEGAIGADTLDSYRCDALLEEGIAPAAQEAWQRCMADAGIQVESAEGSSTTVVEPPVQASPAPAPSVSAPAATTAPVVPTTAPPATTTP